MTPAQRKARARLAAHIRWSKCEDRQAALAPAKTAFLARFEHQVDPDRTLTPDERQKRAGSALKAHMARMALARHS